MSILERAPCTISEIKLDGRCASPLEKKPYEVLEEADWPRIKELQVLTFHLSANQRVVAARIGHRSRDVVIKRLPELYASSVLRFS